MLRPLLAVLTALALLLPAACGDGTTAMTPPPTAGPSAPSVLPNGSQVISTPAPSPVPAPAEDWQNIYLRFLSDSRETLPDAFGEGGVAGLGFIDLDLDGAGELILLDAGVSASCGVALFDIDREGRVVCIGARLESVCAAFGGDTGLPAVYAGGFEDFRLLRGADGKDFFLIESGNAAEDLLFSEHIRFGSDVNGLLTLTGLFSRCESFDPESDTVVSEQFSVGGKAASRGEYESAKKVLYDAVSDLNYIPAGVFVHENSRYESPTSGLTAMARDALARFSD